MYSPAAILYGKENKGRAVDGNGNLTKACSCTNKQTHNSYNEVLTGSASVPSRQYDKIPNAPHKRPLVERAEHLGVDGKRHDRCEGKTKVEEHDRDQVLRQRQTGGVLAPVLQTKFVGFVVRGVEGVSRVRYAGEIGHEDQRQTQDQRVAVTQLHGLHPVTTEHGIALLYTEHDSYHQ